MSSIYNTPAADGTPYNAAGRAIPTPQQVSDARDWTSDCLQLDGDERVDERYALIYVKAHYPGGWRQFAIEMG